MKYVTQKGYAGFSVRGKTAQMKAAAPEGPGSSEDLSWMGAHDPATFYLLVDRTRQQPRPQPQPKPEPAPAPHPQPQGAWDGHEAADSSGAGAQLDSPCMGKVNMHGFG